MTQKYEQLPAEQRVRVNAVILEQFSANPDHFITQFRDLVKSDSQGREAGFQHTLDAMRNVLAQDARHLPQIANHDANAVLNLGAQKDLLRTMKQVMGAERPGAEYPEAHYQNIVAHAQPNVDSVPGYKLPKLTAPYEGAAQLIANTRALEACSGLSENTCRLAPNVAPAEAPSHVPNVIPHNANPIRRT